MKKSELTNAKLLNSFENACFQLAHNPGGKARQANFAKYEEMIAERLGVSAEELELIRKGEI